MIRRLTLTVLISFFALYIFAQGYYKISPELIDQRWTLVSNNEMLCSIDADTIINSLYHHFPYRLDGKWGVIDKECKYLIKNSYHFLKEISADEFKVSLDGSMGVIDLDGKQLLAMQYDDIDSHVSEKYLVKTLGKWKYVDSTGQEIVSKRLYFKNPDLQALFTECEKDVSEQEHKKCSNEALLHYIYGNLKYPSEARQNRTEGMVVIQMSISPEGKVVEPKIVRDIGDSCGEAALNVFKNMPDWFPAEHEGNGVWSFYTVPVRFKLE